MLHHSMYSTGYHGKSPKWPLNTFFCKAYNFLFAGNTLILVVFLHVIATLIICIFTLAFVYATLTTILMIFLFSNAGQISKDAFIGTLITQHCLPAYPNPNLEMKINMQTRRLSNLKALYTFTQEQSLRVLKLTKRKQNKQVRKQARKK